MRYGRDISYQALVSIGLAAGALAVTGGVAQAQKKTRVNVAVTETIASVSPYADSVSLMYTVFCQTYGCFFDRNYTAQNYTSRIVDKWEVKDPTTWVFQYHRMYPSADEAAWAVRSSLRACPIWSMPSGNMVRIAIVPRAMTNRATSTSVIVSPGRRVMVVRLRFVADECWGHSSGHTGKLTRAPPPSGRGVRGCPGGRDTLVSPGEARVPRLPSKNDQGDGV